MKTDQKATSPNVPMTDVATLRERARTHVENGAVTTDYPFSVDWVVKLLNEALATEIVCTLRYRRHYFVASGLYAQSIAAEFKEHSDEELGHADLLAKRIVQLGGKPNFSPEGLLERSHAQYIEGDSLREMIRENLVAERVAIESYREMVAAFGHKDPTTRSLLESILATEEEHAEDLSSMLEGMGV